MSVPIKKNVNKLQRIQCRTARLILKSKQPYDVLLSKLNLLNLERLVAGVIFLCKAPNGHLYVDFSQFLDFYGREDRYLLKDLDTKSLKKEIYQGKHTIKNSHL